MNKIILTLLMTTALSTAANAQNCVNASRCDELGYDKSIEDCKGYSTLICPFDKNRAFCSTSAGIAQVSDCTGLKAAVTNAGTTIYITKNISTCSLSSIADYVSIIGDGTAKEICIGSPKTGKNVTFENLKFCGKPTGPSLKLINLSAQESKTIGFTVTDSLYIENCNLPEVTIDIGGSADLTVKGENKLEGLQNVNNINQIDGSLTLSGRILKINSGTFNGELTVSQIYANDSASSFTFNGKFFAKQIRNGTYIFNEDTSLKLTSEVNGASFAIEDAKIIANKKLQINTCSIIDAEFIINDEADFKFSNYYTGMVGYCSGCKFTVNGQLVYWRSRSSNYSDQTSLCSGSITLTANGKFYSNDEIGRGVTINYTDSAQIGFTEMNSCNGLWQASSSGSFPTSYPCVMPPEFTKISATSPLP